MQSEDITKSKFVSVTKRSLLSLHLVEKYTCNVMPFGSCNDSTLYTMVTCFIQDEATKLSRVLCNEQVIDLKQHIMSAGFCYLKAIWNRNN